ncbi:MAG: DinB family protein [Saprospiraceae bacterium]|nr:DinB family protein [Saprospiraceae bacterium]
MASNNWGKDLDETTDRFINNFGELNLQQLNFRLDINRWSIAQNIAHIMLLNKSYFQNFEEIENGLQVLPSIDTMDQLVADSLEVLQPYTREDRPKKAKTWDIWQPSGEIYGIKIWNDFTQHQTEFKLHIKKLESFFFQKTYIKYPGEAELYFLLEDCIDFLIEHERRHWQQAMEVKSVLDKSIKNYQ